MDTNIILSVKESKKIVSDKFIFLAMKARGDRFRAFALLQSKNLSAFATLLGTHPQNLNRYVNGERFPSDEILEKIAALGCNIHWLLTGEGSMFAENEAGRALAAKHQGTQAAPALVPIAVTEDDKKVLNSVVIDMDDAQALERVLEKIRAARVQQ